MSAHNAFENTATARIHSDRMEIEMTTGLTTARTIDANGGDLALLDRSTLPELQKRFLAGAGNLFEVTSQNAPLALKKADVKIDAEDEVHFVLVYPRPPAGPFSLRASHVSKQPYGGTYLTILGETHGPPVTKLLMADEIVMTGIALKPPEPLPPSPPRRLFYAVLVLVVLGGAIWLRVRTAKS